MLLRYWFSFELFENGTVKKSFPKYPGHSFEKKKKWKKNNNKLLGNLTKFKLLAFAAPELAVPINFRVIMFHITVVEFKFLIKVSHLTSISLALGTIVLLELLLTGVQCIMCICSSNSPPPGGSYYLNPLPMTHPGGSGA